MTDKRLYHLITIIIVSIWGTTFVSTKVLLNNGMTPIWIFLLRFSISYLALLMIERKYLKCHSFKDEFYCFLSGIFGGSLYFIAENMALEKTTVSNVAFIVCTAPVFTLFISSVFLKRTGVSIKVLVGLIVSMIGMSVLLFKDFGELRFNPMGDLLALAAAVLWAVYSILLSNLIGKYNVKFITRKTFFYGIVTCIPMLLLDDVYTDFSLLFKFEIVFNLFYLSIVASLGCYFLWGKVVNILGSVKACNYLYINPVAAVVTSVVILGEKLTGGALLGMIIVLIGVFLTQMRFNK